MIRGESYRVSGCDSSDLMNRHAFSLTLNYVSEGGIFCDTLRMYFRVLE